MAQFSMCVCHCFTENPMLSVARTVRAIRSSATQVQPAQSRLQKAWQRAPIKCVKISAMETPLPPFPIALIYNQSKHACQSVLADLRAVWGSKIKVIQVVETGTHHLQVPICSLPFSSRSSSAQALAQMHGSYSAAPRTPTTPPPPGASGQQLVVKGAGLRSPWAPKAPHAPRAPKLPEGNFGSLCSPTLSLNPTLTLTPTRALRLVLTLPLPLLLTRIEYWDRAGGGRNIV